MTWEPEWFDGPLPPQRPRRSHGGEARRLAQAREVDQHAASIEWWRQKAENEPIAKALYGVEDNVEYVGLLHRREDFDADEFIWDPRWDEDDPDLSRPPRLTRWLDDEELEADVALSGVILRESAIRQLAANVEANRPRCEDCQAGLPFSKDGRTSRCESCRVERQRARDREKARRHAAAKRMRAADKRRWREDAAARRRRERSADDRLVKECTTCGLEFSQERRPGRPFLRCPPCRGPKRLGTFATNRYPGPCAKCGLTVPASEGTLSAHGTAWRVWHVSDEACREAWRASAAPLEAVRR